MTVKYSGYTLYAFSIASTYWMHFRSLTSVKFWAAQFILQIMSIICQHSFWEDFCHRMQPEQLNSTWALKPTHTSPVWPNPFSHRALLIRNNKCHAKGSGTKNLQTLTHSIFTISFYFLNCTFTHLANPHSPQISPWQKPLLLWYTWLFKLEVLSHANNQYPLSSQWFPVIPLSHFRPFLRCNYHHALCEKGSGHETTTDTGMKIMLGYCPKSAHIAKIATHFLVLSDMFQVKEAWYMQTGFSVARR